MKGITFFYSNTKGRMSSLAGRVYIYCLQESALSKIPTFICIFSVCKFLSEFRAVTSVTDVKGFGSLIG